MPSLTHEFDLGHRRVLRISGILNGVLMLAVALTLLHSRPLPPTITGAPAGPAVDSAAAPSALAPTDLRRAPSARTPWSRVYSTHLPTFAANLRAADCPPATVCDLLEAESRRLFRAEIQNRPENRRWLIGSAYRDQVAELRRQQRSGELARQELLAEIGCTAASVDGELGVSWAAFLDLATGFAPPDVRRLVRLEGAQLKRDAETFREELDQVVLPAERARRESAGHARIARLKELLGEAGYDEMCLRIEALMAVQSPDRAALVAVGVTPAELRELVRREHLAGESNAERQILRAGLPDDDVRRPSHRNRREDLAAVLGPDRAAELRWRIRPERALLERWQEDHALAPAEAREVERALEQLRDTVAASAATAGNDPEGVRAAVRAGHEAARLRLEQALAVVPGAERDTRIREWLRQSALEGWSP